jgi:hypothetical protein
MGVMLEDQSSVLENNIEWTERKIYANSSGRESDTVSAIVRGF